MVGIEFELHRNKKDFLIVVPDHGKVAEDSTYYTLIEKNGLFAELVKRQRIRLCDPLSFFYFIINKCASPTFYAIII